MARTRWQRRWTVASTTDQLRAVAVLLAVLLVGLDIALDGVVPVAVVLVAGGYVFIEGCYRASRSVASRLFG